MIKTNQLVKDYWSWVVVLTNREDIVAALNILAARNRESGNLEIRVPVLGNHLFCA